MKCKYCGASIEENDVFCQTCGRPVNEQTPESEAVSEPTVTPATPVPQVDNSAEEAAKNARNINAILSLIFSIVSLACCGGIMGFTSVVLGILGLKSNKRGMAIAGIVIGVLSFLVLAVTFIIGFVAAFEHMDVYEDIFSSFNY